MGLDNAKIKAREVAKSASSSSDSVLPGVAVFSGIYAYVTVPAFTALHAAMVGGGTAFMAVVHTFGGALGGSALFAVAGAALGGIAGFFFGQSKGKEYAEKATKSEMDQLIIDKVSSGKQVSDEDRQTLSSKIDQKRKSLVLDEVKTTAAASALVGGCSGLVLGGIFGLVSGVYNGYTEARDDILAGIQAKEKAAAAVMQAPQSNRAEVDKVVLRVERPLPYLRK